MIDVRSLRIGNWVIHSSFAKPVQIEGVDTNGSLIMLPNEHGEGGVWNYLEGANPIPITPEILEACGFDYHGDEYWLPFCREYDDKTCHLIVGRLVDDPPGMYYFSVKVPSGTAAINNVYHIHQVQNIAHSITGKELTYSPNNTVK